MRRSGEDVNINDYLTEYLKNFKNNFNAQLSMVESLLTDLPNIDDKIKKANQSIKAMYEQSGSISGISARLNGKTLQRFCLRINEYIEYRTSKCRGAIEQPFMDEINAMCIAMHRLFAQFNKGKTTEEDQSLASLFSRIEQVENQHITRILKKIMQQLQLNKMHSDIPEIMGKIEMIKEQKGLKNKMQAERTLPTQSSTGHEKRIDFGRRFSDSHYAARLRCRKSTFERMQHIPSIASPPNVSQFTLPKSVYVNSHVVLRTPEEIDQFTTELKPAKHQKMSKMYSTISDVIDINWDINPLQTAESVMKELLQNNKVNQAIINKFRRKANKIRLKLQAKGASLEQQKQIEQQLSPSKVKPNETMQMQVRHKRSYTLDTSNSRPNARKEEKFLGLPMLKRKIIKN